MVSYRDTLRTSKKVKPLSALQKKVKIGEKKVYVEKTALFTRLTLLAEREGSVEAAFEYELTPVPTSLFIMDRMMRKSAKADFGKILKANAEEVKPEDLGVVVRDDGSHDQSHLSNVVDGGWFLHQVPWIGSKLKHIARSYTTFFYRRFGAALMSGMVILMSQQQKIMSMGREWQTRNHPPMFMSRKIQP